MSTTWSLALCMVSIDSIPCDPSQTDVVLGYLQHDIDRAIIIDFDLHHGNGTQALIMPLNAASYADDLQVKAGKPPITGQGGRRRRGWKAFYGSVHDIVSPSGKRSVDGRLPTIVQLPVRGTSNH